MERRLIDCHAHLADAVFDSDRGEVLERARASGITHVVTVGETLEDARRSIAEGIPHGWAEPDSDAVWWDTEETLRAPGHSTNYVVGRNMIQGLMAARARQLGDHFTLKRFFGEFMNAGIVPIALTHWELTGRNDEIKKLWE